MHRLLRWACALFLAAGVAAPAHAQMRTLEVPAGKGWKHAQTGVVLRAALAGYPRTQLVDNSTGEYDVMASFAAPDNSTIITVYIFQPALMSAPVWFDRAESQILLRDTWGNAQPHGAPQAFARPGATAASGLRRIYVPGKGPFKSTGLAMMPLGEWLVAVRISSTQFDPAQLDARMSDIIAAIGWPAGVTESPAAAPVAACPAPLPYAKRAKLKKATMNDAIFGALLSGIATEKEEKGEAVPIGALCRDLPPTQMYGVYRAPDANGYVMAIGDAGRTLSVGPSLAGLIEKSAGYSVSFGDVDGSTSVYPSFDRLPHPDQALKALQSSSPISRSSKDSKEITIGMPAK
jgi:hypothetical protein